MRSVRDTAPAAFLGGLAFCAPGFLDHKLKNGTIAKGMFNVPSMIARFGAESFDHGNEHMRWSVLISSECRLGNALRDSHESLRNETGNPIDGPLGGNVDAFGSGSKIQQAIMRQREEVRFEELNGRILNLDGLDTRRRAWLAQSKTSRVWIDAWPSSIAHTEDREWREITSAYYGLESPICRGILGKPIGLRGDRRVQPTVDAYGDSLCSATLQKNVALDHISKLRHDPSLTRRLIAPGYPELSDRVR